MMTWSARRPQRLGAARSRGLSLVELMVGVAVGLFVVAAAALMVSTQLADNRRLLAETQLQQDLRASADIVTRELRRAGYWRSSYDGVPTQAGSVIANNTYLGMSLPTTPTGALQYNYYREGGAETFSFQRDDNGVLKSCQRDFDLGGCTGGQDLTDASTVYIVSFSIQSTREGARARPANDDLITLPCPNLCADGTTACWPKVGVREVVVTITGRSRSDPSVERTLTSSVRVRNDRVNLSTEAPSGQSCPAA